MSEDLAEMGEESGAETSKFNVQGTEQNKSELIIPSPILMVDGKDEESKQKSPTQCVNISSNNTSFASRSHNSNDNRADPL